jgi:uncharacterized membrane protein
MKFLCKTILIPVVSFLSLSCFAQTQSCVSGTLANVLGTSCSIGNVTYTFANNFSGFHQIDDATNTLQTTFLTPDVIGFEPISTATQSGFRLVANFHENTDAFNQSFSQSTITFSYGLAVNGNFQIMDETGTIFGSVTQAFFLSDISGFDAHCFTNSGCIQVFQQVAFIPGFGFSSEPTSSATLPIPGLISLGSFTGSTFTTELTAFAQLGDSANLDSATYLYSLAPQVPAPPLAKLNYTSIDIPGATSSIVEGINDAGDTVGIFSDGAGTHAFMQDHQGLHELSFPAGTATPLAINNRGDIVGSIRDAARHTHGFLLQDGVLTILDFPGAVLTIAEGINDHGEICGLFQPNGLSVHGFRLDSQGFTSIDHPGARGLGFTEAIGINNQGDISGFFLDSFGRDNPFIYSAGTFQDVVVPGGFSPFLEGLDDHGAAVGGYRDLHGGSHGFVVAGGTVDTVDFPGARSTTAVQINTPGRILGRYIDTAGRAHSFLADRAPDDGSAPLQPDTSDMHSPVRVCTDSDQVTDRLDLKNPQSCPSN